MVRHYPKVRGHGPLFLGVVPISCFIRFRITLTDRTRAGGNGFFFLFKADQDKTFQAFRHYREPGVSPSMATARGKNTWLSTAATGSTGIDICRGPYYNPSQSEHHSVFDCQFQMSFRLGWGEMQEPGLPCPLVWL